MNLTNHVTISGTVMHRPEIREVATGRKIARMSVATATTYKDQDGETVTDTQWRTVVAYGTIADKVDKMFKQGDNVSLEGRTTSKSFRGKDGHKRTISELVLYTFKHLD